jgi:asparaginyl-tRNA synthetase
MVKQLISRLNSEKLPAILHVQTSALRAISDYMRLNDVPQIMPILLSPITDPLSHSVFDAEIEYYDQRLQLTKSITVHKPLILMGKLSSFHCLSPNIRLEKAEKGQTGRHLIEFTQLEMEFKGYDKNRFMEFVEGLVKYVIMRVRDECPKELKALHRKLKYPKGRFLVFESSELEMRHGEGFDDRQSAIADKPFWILSFKREFYDREDKLTRGYYHNYDLIWPEGFGEALSGGEREYEYEEVLRKMGERGMSLQPYKNYLAILKTGNVPSTAGGGLGIERLVRFLTGMKDIDSVTLFPRKAGGRITL